MQRLTEKAVEDGIEGYWLIEGGQPIINGLKTFYTNADEGFSACEKLAAYEDTGIRPEDIEDLKLVLDYENDGKSGIQTIKDLLELMKYRSMEHRLKTVFGGTLPLEKYVELLEKHLTEPDKENPLFGRVLTYEDAEKWDSYKALGTVEECREAMEKQKAKKPLKQEYVDEAVLYVGFCPNCGSGNSSEFNFCKKCGQKFDWSAEDGKE